MDINMYNLDQVEKNTQSLHKAIEEDNTVLALQLLSVSNPRLWHSQSLWTAVMRNNIVMVDALIPFSDPSDPMCKAIELAAQEGHEKIVCMLIPAILDIQIFNQAFASALLRNQITCAQFLFDVCEPDRTVNSLLLSLPDQSGRDQVEQRFAELKKHRIVQHLDTKCSSPRKERKI